MAKPSYYDLLRHPLWQRKRLEIMERDGFECVECGDTETTLNVHHSYYTKGAKPWEYPSESLRCLCEKCHSERHETQSLIARLVGELPLNLLTGVLGYVGGVWMIGSANDPPPQGRFIRVPEGDELLGWFAGGIYSAFDIPGRSADLFMYSFGRDGFEGEWLDIDALKASRSDKCEAARMERRNA